MEMTMSDNVNFQLNGNRVLVRLHETTKTESGLHIPQTVEQQLKRATVVVEGSQYWVGTQLVQSNFSKGDDVLVDSLGAQKIELRGKTYYIVRNEDIVGWFTE
jgi:co-chaperonin GroES (HSP10)